MQKIDSKKATTYLQSDDQDLQFVFARIKKLKALSDKVMPHLNPVITPYCQVANMVGNKLILIVANGSVATQIRFDTDMLLKKLHATNDPMLKIIQFIHCKVEPNLASEPRKTKRKNASPLSQEAANSIQAMALTLDHEPLKAVMTRIASRTKK